MRFECRNFVIYLFESDRNKVSSTLIKLLHVENILVVICVVDCNISTAYCLSKFRETYRSQLITIFVVDLNVNSIHEMTEPASDVWLSKRNVEVNCGTLAANQRKKERKVAQPKSSFFSSRPNFSSSFRSFVTISVSILTV